MDTNPFTGETHLETITRVSNSTREQLSEAFGSAAFDLQTAAMLGYEPMGELTAWMRSHRHDIVMTVHFGPANPSTFDLRMVDTDTGEEFIVAQSQVFGGWRDLKPDRAGL